MLPVARWSSILDVGSTPLARLVDRDALDASIGGRARLRIDVPAAWLEEGAEVELTAPGRLPCAGCGGGGCDACARSGVFRAPEAPGERVLHAHLPRAQASCAALALRIVQPFGPSSAIEHLVIELRVGPGPSAGVTRVAPPLTPSGGGAELPRRAVVTVALSVIALAVVLAALLGR
jgi:hypothetical protein